VVGLDLFARFVLESAGRGRKPWGTRKRRATDIAACEDCAGCGHEQGVAGGYEKEPVLACGLRILSQPEFFRQIQCGPDLFREHQQRAFWHPLGQRPFGFRVVDEEVDT
jgi:hypothetical protein